MAQNWSRRHLLKALGIAAGSIVVPKAGFAFGPNGEAIALPELNTLPKLDKPITAITIGAGNRGNVYGNFATKYPDQLDIIGVAEPIQLRNERFSEKHTISSENRFQTWEDVFKRPKFADAVIIGTPDNLHYGPCMQALKMGYHVLLEKPIAPTEKECRDILALAKKTDKVIAVCHVLRYAPYFGELRNIIASGAIGKLVSIQHFEPIEHVHMSHSYVRGNWHNSKATTPIILAKSCHDLDILRWIVGKPVKQISAMGSLSWFKKENAPEGSTACCMDGCAVEGSCPYSAMEIYLRKRKRLYAFDLPMDKAEWDGAITNILKTTNYGRCVYRMENDQPDHYISNILFEDGVTASFSMEAFTSYEGRRTRVMGSMGDIVGDMQQFVLTDFRTGKKTEWSKKTDNHGGGDWRLVADWVKAVAENNPSLLTSTIDASVESHVMAFKAEQSRLQSKVMDVRV